MRARVEVAVAVLLSAAAATLHLIFFRSAGPLWRDEAGCLHGAIAPLRVLWQRLQFESFPLVSLMIVRGWSAAFGKDVVSLRLLGALVGIAGVAAIWLTTRTLGSRTPVIALPLAALSGTVVRFGDSIRGYGSSVVAGLLSVAAMYAAATTQKPRAWAFAALAAIVSVHTTFFNSVLLFAVCIAAASIATSTRDAAKPLAVGLLAALSLLVYVPMFRTRAQWTSIESFGVDLRWIANQTFAALATSGWITAWLVLVTTGAAFVVGIRSRNATARFLTITLALTIGGQVAFLRALRYEPEPWYFVLAIAAAAVCVDALLRDAAHGVRIAIAVVLAAAALQPSIRYVSMRASSVDVVASATNALAKAGDVVIVYPWYCGVSFRMHAKGGWMTLPPLGDYSVHRYDLLLPLLGRREAAQPVLDAAARSLQSGHRVWLAGFPLCSDSAWSMNDPRTATLAVRSDAMWCGALRETLRANANRASLVVPPDPGTIIYERMQLVAFERAR